MADMVSVAWAALNSALSVLPGKVAEMSGRTIPAGLGLTGVLSLWALMWHVIDFYAANNFASWTRDTLQTVIRVAILTALLLAYASANGPKGWLVQGADELVMLITGSSDANPCQIALTQLAKAIQAVSWMNDVSQSGAADAGLSISAYNPMTLLMELHRMLVRLLLIGLLSGLLTICGVVYCGIYLLSNLTLSIAIIMGPLMLPWLLMERFEWLADSWIKFSIGAALYKVVAAILFMLGTELVIPAQTTAKLLSQQLALETGTKAYSPMVDLFAAAPVVMILMLVIMMMSSAPSIAANLLSGNASVRLGRFPLR
ncbi:type IV secretion system protein [Parachitinimonas caeni]|uniref:Type IV secretion system protein n=1 Tax=Parachitinimonas caeni TaxID=3031301 RepID=A0ABT7E5S9_9NEIS|nr:type IV secretion system protein [Parachitinimonas caeni]MDK2126267.1 type IV secretion system protein [Parachitinimonas caeni]